MAQHDAAAPSRSVIVDRVVGAARRGLEDEDLLSADRLPDLDVDLSVREPADVDRVELEAEHARDRRRERGVRRAGEEPHIVGRERDEREGGVIYGSARVRV